MVSIALMTMSFGTRHAEVTQIADGSMKIRCQVIGGHDTNPVDRGRPVVLIAAALNVTTEIFREAFSRVQPAPAGSFPSSNRVHQNKQVLLSALAKHGVSNERLDEVSDYYRYNPSGGGLWPTEDAVIYAIVKDNAVVRFEIEQQGAGYSSTPRLEVPSLATPSIKVQLSFGAQLEKNGSIESVELAE